MATAQEIPSEMKAAAIDRFGPPDVLHIETVPVPKLAKNEILVQVATAGVGTWDPDLIEGSFQDTKPRFPHVFGSDGAGTVVVPFLDCPTGEEGDQRPDEDDDVFERQARTLHPDVVEIPGNGGHPIALPRVRAWAARPVSAFR